MAAIDGADGGGATDAGPSLPAPSRANGTASAGSTPAQRRAVRRLHAAMESFEAQLQCPICLCAYATPASLPCNHCFCEECIHRALELKQVCPICKAPAKKRSLRHDTMIQQLQQAAELWASVASGVPDHEDEDDEPAKETTPIRINPRIVAAAATASGGSSSGGSSSAESTSRRRKRAAAQALDEPIERSAGAQGNGHVREGDDEDENMDDDGEEEEEDGEEEEEEYVEVLEAKTAIPERARDDLMPSPAKRRAVAATANGFGAKALREAAMQSNGHTSSQLQHSQPRENGTTPHEDAETAAFEVGQLVEVIDRTWRGINKPGGAAWITGANGDGTYDVKYIIGTGRESNIPDQYILIPREEIGSLATPGRAVKQHRRKQTKLVTPPSVDLLSVGGFTAMGTARMRRSDLVFLCSGYTDDEVEQIKMWAQVLGAEVVDNWSNFVTHLIAKCATPKEVAASLAEEDHYSGASSSSTTGAHSRKRALFKEEKHKRWVKIRSMKYLKALVAGRWIVSEQWLRDSVKQGKRLAEASYEADGHLKAQNVVAACQRSRAMREEFLRTSTDEVNPLTVGTKLFADFCFHIYGEFLPPMPPPLELSTLIGIGGGKTIHFLDDIAMEMDKPENCERTLVIVSDKLNQQMLRRAAKELTALPQLQGVVNKHVVSYQWILNSISEAKLRVFN